MTSPKDTRTIINCQYYVIIFAAMVFAAVMFMKHCGNNSRPDINYKQKYDSLTNVFQVSTKQYGLDKAEWEKEVVLNQQRDRNQQAKIIALQERSEQQTIQYSQVVKTIKHSAPDTCQPYIEQMDNEHYKVINAKDDLNAAIMERCNSLQSDLTEAMEFIQVQDEKIASDSMVMVGKDKVNEGLIKELKKATRKGYFKGLWHGTILGAAIKTTIDLLITKN